MIIINTAEESKKGEGMIWWMDIRNSVKKRYEYLKVMVINECIENGWIILTNI